MRRFVPVVRDEQLVRGERGGRLRYRRFEVFGKWVDASVEQRDRVDGDDAPRQFSIVCPGCWVSDGIPQMGEGGEEQRALRMLCFALSVACLSMDYS